MKLTGMSVKVAGKYTTTRLKHSLASEEKKEEALSEMYGDIGEQVLKALHQHDRLAYVRYLSVHQQMETSDEIKSLIGELENLLASDSYEK